MANKGNDVIANIVGGESNGAAIKVPDDTLHCFMAKKTPIACTPWVRGMVPEIAIQTEAYTVQRWAKGQQEFAFLVPNGMPAIESRTLIHRALRRLNVQS